MGWDALRGDESVAVKCILYTIYYILLANRCIRSREVRNEEVNEIVVVAAALMR